MHSYTYVLLCTDLHISPGISVRIIWLLYLLMTCARIKRANLSLMGYELHSRKSHPRLDGNKSLAFIKSEPRAVFLIEFIAILVCI